MLMIQLLKPGRDTMDLLSDRNLQSRHQNWRQTPNLVPWEKSRYYFYTRCKEHSDIDSIFQLTMDESLKGNSIKLQMMIWMLHPVQQNPS